MTTSAPSTRAIVLAVAGLVIIPAVSLIVVISRHDPGVASVEPESTPEDEPKGSPEEPREAPLPQPTQPDPVPPAQTVGIEAGSPSVLANEQLALARRLENTDPKRSRDLLRQILQADPTNGRALESLATKLLIDEKFIEALDLANRCVGVNQASAACGKIAELNIKLTPELEKLGRLNDECVRTQPDNLNCAYPKFNAQIVNGQVDEATALADRMSQVNPNDARSQLARGRLRAAAGAYGDARTLFDAACKQGDDQACFRAQVLRSEGW